MKESIQAYDQAIALNPEMQRLGMEKEWIWDCWENMMKHFRHLKELPILIRQYAEAWFNMGVIYDLQERYSEAIQAYNKATEINPPYQKAWINKNQDIDLIESMTPSCAM